MNFRIVLLLSFFFSQSALAQIEPLEADRPDQTESPSTVLKKHLQFETGIVFEKDNLESTETNSFTLPTLLVKYGVGENLELRLIVENAFVETKDAYKQSNIKGISPIEAGLKLHICEE